MAKTREEYMQELAEHRAAAEKYALAYNAALIEGKTDEANRIEKQIDTEIEEHGTIAELLAFDTCIKSENPMITAVTNLTYDTIARKDTKEKDATIATRSIETKTKYIDLKKLHKKVSGGIGADKNWIYMVEQLNMRMTAKCAIDLGCNEEDLKKINNSYAMSDLARKIKLGANPCSNTQMLKTLQTIVTAMLGGEYKATSHDVEFIKKIYAKKGRAALAVSCANHTNFRRYIAEVCHRIVTNGSYSVEYKKEKGK